FLSSELRPVSAVVAPGGRRVGRARAAPRRAASGGGRRAGRGGPGGGPRRAGGAPARRARAPLRAATPRPRPPRPPPPALRAAAENPPKRESVMALVSYLSKDDVAEKLRPTFEGMERKLGAVPHVFQAMAHSPEMLEGFLSLNAALARTKLDGKLRELAYIQT